METQRGLEGQMLLLLTEGFSEAQATLYISELREAGLPVKTVGLTRRPVRSEHGVEIVPDLSVDQVIRTPPRVRLLILPRGESGMSIWRADPRMRGLLELVQEQGGWLVATEEMVEALGSMLSPNPSLQVCEEPPTGQRAAAPRMFVLSAPAENDARIAEFVQRLAKWS